MFRGSLLAGVSGILVLSACSDAQTASTVSPTQTASTAAITGERAPTVQDAKEFLEAAEAEYKEFSGFASRAYWVQANFMTEDTNALAAMAGMQGAELSTRLANEAKRYNDVALPPDMRRKMDGLKRGSNFPAPERPGAARELAQIMAGLDSIYAKGTFPIDTSDPKVVEILGELEGNTINLGQATKIMAQSDDPDLLQAVWEGWRTISPPMKDDYARMVEIINEGAQELGYADAGALWRAGYDMDADDFVAETERLYGQIAPLYEQLHCYVRGELNETYGDEVVPDGEPIRADILGNMWAQNWVNTFDYVAPESAGPGVDVTELLVEQGYDQERMVRTGETFFTSLGFDPLPETFWQRSLITKPADRDVQCHASAWNLDDEEDIRIKMCTEVTGVDFETVHHELGHNIYQRAYKDQPIFYRAGANDGFHEAIGDMIALSITPDYLVEVGLLDESDKPSEDEDIAVLMRQALSKVAFVPFGLMVDQWRWKVFSGEYSPSEYNSGWWELREKYQGVRPPSDRPADVFDAGAKYHIPGNTPYMRYFLAHVLQFQFHKAACDIAGYEGALHNCSIYGNEEVGTRFNAMMEMGASKPWPDALETFTGTRKMDGTAMLEYFAPLSEYLQAENAGRTCGW